MDRQEIKIRWRHQLPDSDASFSRARVACETTGFRRRDFRATLPPESWRLTPFFKASKTGSLARTRIGKNRGVRNRQLEKQAP
jgi:hypothetical protein